MLSLYLKPIPCALNPISFHSLRNHTPSTIPCLSNIYDQFLSMDTSQQIFKRVQYFPFKTSSSLGPFFPPQRPPFSGKHLKRVTHTHSLHSFYYDSPYTPSRPAATLKPLSVGVTRTSMLWNPSNALLSSSFWLQQTLTLLLPTSFHS